MPLDAGKFRDLNLMTYDEYTEGEIEKERKAGNSRRKRVMCAGLEYASSVS